ncbi:MAG: hypothetical protein IKF58_11480, partial [Bacillus sp. (in: Bacteria)]|nr:hypothetical protein [Bacillus sp. (in: firmicutes)]
MKGKKSTKNTSTDDQVIRINGFEFSSHDEYSEEDLIPYISGAAPSEFTAETRELIEKNISEDSFGLRKALKNIYGQDAEFRDGQQEAILAVLNGKRTLVIQHTGWGKSLINFMSI